MADSKNTNLCPKVAYCRLATRCERLNPRMRKQLKKQGENLVDLSEYEESEAFLKKTEEQLRNLGYELVDEKSKLWRLELERNIVKLDIFEQRQECPEV